MNGQTGKRANGHSETGKADLSDFRQQLLWRKAHELALDIVGIVRVLPRDMATGPIANQLMRSGGSISANIAEGYGRFSQAAYRNHLSIARGSAMETLSWLQLLSDSGYLAPEKATQVRERCLELQRLLTVRMKSLSNGKTYAIGEEGTNYEA